MAKHYTKALYRLCSVPSWFIVCLTRNNVTLGNRRLNCCVSDVFSHPFGAAVAATSGGCILKLSFITAVVYGSWRTLLGF